MYFKLLPKRTLAELEKQKLPIEHLGPKLDLPQDLVNGWMADSPISEQNLGALCGLLGIDQEVIANELSSENFITSGNGSISGGSSIGKNQGNTYITINSFVVADPNQIERVMNSLKSAKEADPNEFTN